MSLWTVTLRWESEIKEWVVAGENALEALTQCLKSYPHINPWGVKVVHKRLET